MSHSRNKFDEMQDAIILEKGKQAKISSNSGWIPKTFWEKLLKQNPELKYHTVLSIRNRFNFLEKKCQKSVKCLPYKREEDIAILKAIIADDKNKWNSEPFWRNLGQTPELDKRSVSSVRNRARQVMKKLSAYADFVDANSMKILLSKVNKNIETQDLEAPAQQPAATSSVDFPVFTKMVQQRTMEKEVLTQEHVSDTNETNNPQCESLIVSNTSFQNENGCNDHGQNSETTLVDASVSSASGGVGISDRKEDIPDDFRSYLNEEEAAEASEYYKVLAPLLSKIQKFTQHTDEEKQELAIYTLSGMRVIYSAITGKPALDCPMGEVEMLVGLIRAKYTTMEPGAIEFFFYALGHNCKIIERE